MQALERGREASRGRSFALRGEPRGGLREYFGKSARAANGRTGSGHLGFLDDHGQVRNQITFVYGIFRFISLPSVCHRAGMSGKGMLGCGQKRFDAKLRGEIPNHLGTHAAGRIGKAIGGGAGGGQTQGLVRWAAAGESKGKTSKGRIAAADRRTRLQREGRRKEKRRIVFGLVEHAAWPQAQCGTPGAAADEIRHSFRRGGRRIERAMQKGGSLVAVWFHEAGPGGKGRAQGFSACIEIRTAAGSLRGGNKSGIKVKGSSRRQAPREDCSCGLAGFGKQLFAISFEGGDFRRRYRFSRFADLGDAPAVLQDFEIGARLAGCGRAMDADAEGTQTLQNLLADRSTAKADPVGIGA